MNRLLKPLLAIILVNVAVIVGITIILFVISYVTGINLAAYWQWWQTLLVWSAILWFVSAIISLFISKWMVKFLYRIEIINPENLYKYDEKVQYLYNKLQQLAQKEWISNIEFGIYGSSEPNAFATWCGLCGRLVAFSTGILQIMDINELDGVLWHEFAHITNGDMVTTTILQGFLNTFVIFISRLIAWIISSDDEGNPNPFVYFIISIVLEILFGILASLVLAWYSRIREYSADKDSALKYSDKFKMAAALEKLKLVSERWVPVDPHNDEFATLKINNFGGKLLNLFSTHPPLEERIKRVLSY